MESAAKPVVLVLPGLSKADRLELLEFVDEGAVTFRDEHIPAGSLGDVTIAAAAIVASAISIKALIGYLVYRHRGKSFEQEVEILKPDGTSVRTRIRAHDTTGEPVNAQIVKQLSPLTGIPESLLDATTGA